MKRKKREEREQQGPKAGKYDRSMNGFNRSSARGGGGVLLSYDNYSMFTICTTTM
jgi:hypothetical protein